MMSRILMDVQSSLILQPSACEPLKLATVKSVPNEITATVIGGYGGYEYFFQGVSYLDVNVCKANEDNRVNIRVIYQGGCEVTIVIASLLNYGILV